MQIFYCKEFAFPVLFQLLSVDTKILRIPLLLHKAAQTLYGVPLIRLQILNWGCGFVTRICRCLTRVHPLILSLILCLHVPQKKKIMPTHCYKSLVRRVILYTHYFELAWTLHILECDGNLWIVSLSD